MSACLSPAEQPSTETDERPVINGTQTPAGIYEATGALMYDGSFGCTGTLIAPTVVLTAGHCLHPDFVGPSVPGFTLALDANAAAPADIYDGLESHPHPQFEIDEFPIGIGQWFDIGILILAEPVLGVPYEVLPTPQEATALAADLRIELVGYGVTDNNNFDGGVKFHGEGRLVEIGDHELLVSDPGEQQNCFGDSGGPGLTDLGNGRRLVGIVSRSPDDNSVCDHGGIDTRVDPYLPWIDSVIGGLCGDAGSCIPDNDAGPVDAGTPDAGAPDAGAPDVSDAGDPIGPDASDSGADGDTGGCSCRTGGGGDPGGAALLALIVLVALRRRSTAAP